MARTNSGTPSEKGATLFTGFAFKSLKSTTTEKAPSSIVKALEMDSWDSQPEMGLEVERTLINAAQSGYAPGVFGPIGNMAKLIFTGRGIAIKTLCGEKKETFIEQPSDNIIKATLLALSEDKEEDGKRKKTAKTQYAEAYKADPNFNYQAFVNSWLEGVKAHVLAVYPQHKKLLDRIQEL